MKAEGFDVITNERLEWENITKIYYEHPEKYYVLEFEDGTYEDFDGIITLISEEE
jgi:hypothetical protein